MKVVERKGPLDHIGSPAPDTWGIFAGINGQTHYLALQDIVGLKDPDEITGGVTLRLTNGQFVSLDKTESLANVLQALGIS